MPEPDDIAQFHSKGFKLTKIPGRGKFPTHDNWQKTVTPEAEILSHPGNLGWLIPKDRIVIDVDVQRKGLENFEKMLSDLNIAEGSLTPTVFTPSGGFHIYCKLPDDEIIETLRAKLNDLYPGIDFKRRGGQVVIPGSFVRDDKTGEPKFYRWANTEEKLTETDLPEQIIKLLKTDKKLENLVREDKPYSSERKSLSVSDIQDMLNYLDPSMPNDDWVEIGMAIHSWDPTATGLSLWETWSRAGSNFTEGDSARRWKSFHECPDGISIGTLIYLASASGFKMTMDKINKAGRHEIETDIASSLRKLRIKKHEKEQAVKAIQERLKQVDGVKPGINDVRNLIYPPVSMTPPECPDWCKEWFFINSQNAFFSRETYSIHSFSSFNFETASLCPANPKTGKRPNPSSWVAENNFIRKVESLAYMPQKRDLIVMNGKRRVLNVFDRDSLPEPASEISSEGEKAIERVENHIRLLFENESELFKQWIAWQVQYPGKKILWAPVVQSIQGAGKSFFRELLQLMLGEENVGVVNSQQVLSQFNSWAMNVCINVLEEIKFAGQNRYEIVNALKPLITDSMIQINEKNIRQYQTYNTTNYICFTNFKDALPAEENDRRWWFIQADIESLNDIKKRTGEDKDIYYPKLFDAIRKYWPEILKHFQSMEITDEFKMLMQAPANRHKEKTIATEKTKIEGLSEAEEMLETEGRFFTKRFLSMTDFFHALDMEHKEIVFNGKMKSNLLIKMGFQSLGKPIYIEGKQRRFWVRSNDIDRDYIKNYYKDISQSNGKTDDKIQEDHFS